MTIIAFGEKHKKKRASVIADSLTHRLMEILLDFDDLAVDQFNGSVPRMRLGIMRTFHSGVAGVVWLGLWIWKHLVRLEDSDLLASGHGFFESFLGTSISTLTFS